MFQNEWVPTVEEFLVAPHETIAQVTPRAVVYAAAGTRRSAALAGLAPNSDDFVRWSRAQMIQACQLMFGYGVQHIFTILAASGQFAEVGTYRDKLLSWLEWGIAGAEALADYRRLSWRVRLLCDEDVDCFVSIQARLAMLTPATNAPTLWFIVIDDPDVPWRWLLSAALRNRAHTRQEAIQALYGEDVPLITLYLAFGKPTITAELLPPLLAGKVECYWTQRPGYSLTDEEFRRILFDYAFLRSTWRANKDGRDAAALSERSAWEEGAILGLGTRLGPFWYPQPLFAQQLRRDALCDN